MTQAASNIAIDRSSYYYQREEKLKSQTKGAVFLTLVVTLFSPPYGAITGTYLLTRVAIEVFINESGIDGGILAARVARTAFSTITALGTTFAVLPLLGFTATSPAIATGIVIFCLNIFTELSSNISANNSDSPPALPV
jgi:hypothetical protein